ncbi:MAG: shikimate dehydrogenase, partial [Acidimicrobiales bacterium]
MISGRTRLAGVIGDPVRHSLSPTIHNAAFAACELDWVYVALPVAAADGRRAVEAMKTFGIGGLSVTMPHKAAVAEAADGLTDAAAALGVSNCLFWGGDRVIGDSTDGDGFLASFEADFGHGLAGKRVLVLGAGGAARAIIEAVGRADAAQIIVCNRSEARAADAAALASRAVVGTLGDAAVAEAADVIVNATAVGMAGGPDPDGIPVPVEALHPGQQVVDIVYQPQRTALLAAAEERGAAVAGGVGMLVHQAALAFE